MKNYSIYLIRHGSTDANETGQYIGSTDMPLSHKGKENLRYFKKKYSYPQAELYYTSPLVRCVETTKILYPKSSPIVINGLAECDFGMWEGHTAQELSHIPMFRDYVSGKSNISPPNGESSKDFTFRIASTFETIVNTMMQTGKTSVVIVTHGGVISTLLALYALPRGSFYDWIAEPGQGFSVRTIPSLWSRDRVVEVFSRIPFLKNGQP